MSKRIMALLLILVMISSTFTVFAEEYSSTLIPWESYNVSTSDLTLKFDVEALKQYESGSKYLKMYIQNGTNIEGTNVGRYNSNTMGTFYDKYVIINAPGYTLVYSPFTKQNYDTRDMTMKAIETNPGYSPEVSAELDRIIAEAKQNAVTTMDQLRYINRYASQAFEYDTCTDNNASYGSVEGVIKNKKAEC